MPHISFADIDAGKAYSRNQLAQLWGYASFHAIARGVETPSGDNKIILFVTEQKQDSAEPYADKLTGQNLEWEGPTDHFAQDRMLRARASGDEIHLFHRVQHRMDFTYFGEIQLVSHALWADRPSQFVFALP